MWIEHDKCVCLHCFLVAAVISLNIDAGLLPANTITSCCNITRERGYINNTTTNFLSKICRGWKCMIVRLLSTQEIFGIWYILFVWMFAFSRVEQANCVCVCVCVSMFVHYYINRPGVWMENTISIYLFLDGKYNICLSVT